MLKNGSSINNIKKILKEKNFKITSTRVAVFEVFTNNSKPISALFIYKQLNKKINEATVYRIITLFEEAELINRIDFKKDYAYFELNSNHHHHIICTKCGEVEDFKENLEIKKLLEKVVIESKKFKNIKEHSLELFGHCKVCS